MKSKKAFIKLDGEVGEKEQPCIEYIDKNYLEKNELQKKKIIEILSRIENNSTLENKPKKR